MSLRQIMSLLFSKIIWTGVELQDPDMELEFLLATAWSTPTHIAIKALVRFCTLTFDASKNRF